MEAGVFPVEVNPPANALLPASPLGALATGARRVVRGWPVLLLMLLGTLFAAGLLALVPAANLFVLAHRPVIAVMAAGIRSWQLVDLAGMLSAVQSSGTGSPVSANLMITLLGFALMPLVGGFVSAFLYGGVLLTYHEARPAFSLGRFLWGCWRWLGSNLALALIQALLFFILLAPAAGVVNFLGNQGPWGIAAAAITVLLAALLGLVIFELARARLVLDDTRNPFKALGLAFETLFRRPLPLLGFYAAALLLLLAVQAAFRLLINPNIPLDALLLALVAQQGFILARLFCRALRLAGLMALLLRWN